MGYKAIFVSLHGTRTEQEVLHKFLDEVKNLELFPSSKLLNQAGKPVYQFPDKLSNLLDDLQNISPPDVRLIILLDEMEILGDFEDTKEATRIAELFCDRNKYPSLIFIHTGSYQWRERVSSPGSLFTHLEPHYLRSIDKNDMINFLLTPLSDDKTKSMVAGVSSSVALCGGGRAVSQSDLFSELSRAWLVVDCHVQRGQFALRLDPGAATARGEPLPTTGGMRPAGRPKDSPPL